MDLNDLKKLSNYELVKKINDFKKEFLYHVFNKENPEKHHNAVLKKREIRKNIARIKTVINSKGNKND